MFITNGPPLAISSLIGLPEIIKNFASDCALTFNFSPFDSKIKAINYAIDTVNGTVYLMGVAQNEWELSLVSNHARSLDYVRRVVSHVRIKSDTAT